MDSQHNIHTYKIERREGDVRYVAGKKFDHLFHFWGLKFLCLFKEFGDKLFEKVFRDFRWNRWILIVVSWVFGWSRSLQFNKFLILLGLVQLVYVKLKSFKNLFLGLDPLKTTSKFCTKSSKFIHYFHI